MSPETSPALMKTFNGMGSVDSLRTVSLRPVFWNRRLQTEDRLEHAQLDQSEQLEDGHLTQRHDVRSGRAAPGRFSRFRLQARARYSALSV